jgi:alpha-L-fucosidase
MKTKYLPVNTVALAALSVLTFTASGQTLSRQACEANIQQQMATMKAGVAAGPYKADWESLQAHNEAPDWFRDAKIGIYFHWGVYSMTAYGNEWYAQRMHNKTGKSYYEHHVKTYGEPDKYPYHNFIPQFKAEKFNAEEWADLFVKTGAKYAGPVCEHHDGYSMWASKLTPWNAGDTGPKRDITGELEKAIRARGMKFVTTFHHERTRTWYPRVEGWPTTTSDPQLQMLYMNIDETLFNQIFQAKLGEVIDRYQPDMIWFDGQMQLIQEPYHLNFLAYYFNQAKKWGREVMVTTKKLQYPQEVSVLDFEKGRANALTPYPWLNDDTISTGSWCYTADLKIKPTIQVLHDFIDAVAKNGQLLLNISPMADGTIPQNQRDCLLSMGAWLKANGEAIYSTRPWLEFGEGPTVLKKSGSFAGSVEYNDKDIRYTRSKDGSTLYAIALGWPQGKFSPTILQIEDATGGQVELVGHPGKLKYQVDGKRISIDVPAQPPGEHAYAFKLTGFKTSITSEAAAAREEALQKLKAEPIDPGKVAGKKGNQGKSRKNKS